MTRIIKKGEENVIDFQSDFRQGQVQEVQQITGGTAICSGVGVWRSKL